MRHKIAGNRLSRNRSLRAATLRDMARAVLLRERICTTRAKAKEARKLIEKLISLGKKDTLAARRRAFAILCDHQLVSRLFQETSPRFKSRPGGYTRIILFEKRRGDNADLAFLELTEKSRELVTGLKKEKVKPADMSETKDAEIKPVEDKSKSAGEDYSKADIKSTAKTQSKPTGIRKFFQRKTGGE